MVHDTECLNRDLALLKTQNAYLLSRKQMAQLTVGIDSKGARENRLCMKDAGRNGEYIKKREGDLT